MGAFHFIEANEETFAWDTATVADDDRTVTLGGIHPPPWWSSETSWWSFARADAHESEKAVSLVLWMRERRPGDDGARHVTDRDRRITVTLPNALGGRVLVDGNARLVEPTGAVGPESAPQRWDRTRIANERTLVVYWTGWRRPHDEVQLDFRDDEVVVTVWQRQGGRAAAGYWAAIVPLAEPVGPRRIVDGALRRSAG